MVPARAAAGSVKVTETSKWQPFASCTVIVYVPAVRELNVPETWYDPVPSLYW